MRYTATVTHGITAPNTAGYRMAKITLSEAARLYKKDRRTIQRHISQGRLSADSIRDGKRLIETAELLRVYGEPNSMPQDAAPASHEAAPQNAAEPKKDNAADVMELLQELKDAHAATVTAQQELLSEQRKRLELQERLLPPPEPKKTTLWKRIKAVFNPPC